MREPSLRALREAPVARELASYGRGELELPKSGAKRHHFNPRLLLRGFAGPSGRLQQLDKGDDGRLIETDLDSAASRRWFYSFPDAEGEKSNELEDWFGLIERHSAPALKRVAETGRLSDTDRATISYFLAMLWARTPAAREMGEALSQEVFKLTCGSHYSDPREFLRSYREQEAAAGAEEKSDAEVEDFRLEILEGVQKGSPKIVDPHGSNVMSILLENAIENVPRLYGAMSWGLISAGEGEFVTSDRAVAVHDPARPYPWSMDALFSSPRSQSTTTVSSKSCLIVVPGRPVFQSHTATASEVEEINLRTYGWADRFVFGATPTVLEGLRERAREEPEAVKEPRPFRNVVLIERDPDDDSIAQEHRARGWPPYIREPAEDGTLRVLDYLVAGVDGDPVEVGVRSNRLARERGLKAAGLPPDSDVGGVDTEVIHPAALIATAAGSFT